MGGDDISIGSTESSFCSKCLDGEKCQICQSPSHLAPACPFISELSKQFKLEMCQICKLASHLAPAFPYLYTVCQEVKCERIQKIKTSKTPDRLFLKCQYSSCGSFEWLDLALSEKSGSSSSASPRQHKDYGYFGCGMNGHWKQHCLWAGSPCKIRICSGKRDLRKSNWVGFEGKKYLICNKCEDFQWFEDAVKLSTPTSNSSTPARIVIDTTLEDLCSKFKGCM